MSPDDASLWLVAADLVAGSELRWSAEHGDEAVFVRSGSLAIDGRTCPTDGAVIVESGVVVTATAESDTSIVHVGPADPAPPADGLRGPADTVGRGVRVIGDEGVHFINYRRDASVMASPNYDGLLLEAGESTNMTWVNDTR